MLSWLFKKIFFQTPLLFLIYCSSAFADFLSPDFISFGFDPPHLRCSSDPPTSSGKVDPLIHKAWHLERIGAFEAWQVSEGDPRITIAFIDSGIHYDHPDLISNLKWNHKECPPNERDDDHNGYVDDFLGWDFVKDSNLPYDRSGHGTFLAGLAAATKDNGIGSAGVCPACSILPIRFLNYEGLGDTEDAIQGIYYAIRMKAQVINFSFAGEGYDPDLYRAIKKAGEHDILVVVSASNDRLNVDYDSIYPAKYYFPHQITVAASNQKDELWDDSNWGKRSVHLAAPGEDVLGPWFEKWDTGSGTSDAAAIVSGAAGLLRSVRPDLTAPQIKNVLINTVRKTKKLKNKIKSGGVLDLDAAVQCIKASVPSCLNL